MDNGGNTGGLQGKVFSRAKRRGRSTGILVRTWLLLAVAAGLSACSCQPPSSAHATRSQVLAFLRREGAYRPATMRLRLVEWSPSVNVGGGWIVDMDEYDANGRFVDRFNLTINAAATVYRDDTCRF